MANLLTRIKDSVMADLHELMDQKEEKKSNRTCEPIHSRM